MPARATRESDNISKWAQVGQLGRAKLTIID